MQITRFAATISLTLAVLAPQTIPIRAVSAPTAATEPFSRNGDIYEIGGSKILMNDAGSRRLLLVDASLKTISVLADTIGSARPYPRFAKFIPYRGDTTLMYDSDSRSLLTIGPDGAFGGVRALPKESDANRITSGGPVGADANGRLVYAGQKPFQFPSSCRVIDGVATRFTPPAPTTDSVAIMRADFDTRSVDTVARVRTAVAGLTYTTIADANCKLTAVKVRVDPSVPETDAWTVTSQGIIAVVRGHDYHIDWLDASGTMRPTPKLPFDSRRLTDADKQMKIDSAKRIVDSLTVRGGYRYQQCGGSTMFTIEPPTTDPRDAARGGGSGGGRGGGSVGTAGSGIGDAPPTPACQTLTATAEYPALDEMPNYIAPVRESSVRADRDGNIWILPTTSSGARGGLLYDVVNPKGELVERVQLPADRAIAGFGKRDVVFLSHRVDDNKMVIERVTVVRR